MTNEKIKIGFITRVATRNECSEMGNVQDFQGRVTDTVYNCPTLGKLTSGVWLAVSCTIKNLMPGERGLLVVDMKPMEIGNLTACQVLYKEKLFWLPESSLRVIKE